MVRKSSAESLEEKSIIDASAGRSAPGRNGFGRFAKNFVKYGAAAIAGTFLFYNTCTKYIRPNEFGIKQVEVSPFGLLGKQGIHNEVYNTGLHVVWPFVEKMHPFPKDIQVLHLHKGEGSSQVDKDDEALVKEEKRYATCLDPANIQTSDGFYITLNVDMLYHIVDPYKVITTLGARRLFESNGVIPKTEPAFKEALGILNPEDFYNSKLRVEKQEAARDLLNTLLKEKGIEINHVLIRYPEYHKDVQTRIEERKLQDQLVYTNQSKAREQAAFADLQKMREEGEAAKLVKLQEGQAYVTRKNSEKSLYERKKTAEADKLVNLADARKTELINTAYQGQGSEKLLGLEMAKVLNGLDNIVIMTGGNQGFNPLDLEGMLKSWNIEDSEGGKSK